MREFLSAGLLDELVEQARASPRRRMHANLHFDASEHCQRLLNAVEPDSYICPHRHLRPQDVETLLVVRGGFVIFRFNDDGTVQSARRLGSQHPGGSVDTFGAEVVPGTWHTLVATEPGSVLFEAKAGPFEPALAKELAPWAPAEGSAESVHYLGELHALAASLA